jgi:hypothetical protein
VIGPFLRSDRSLVSPSLSPPSFFFTNWFPVSLFDAFKKFIFFFFFCMMFDGRNIWVSREKKRNFLSFFLRLLLLLFFLLFIENEARVSNRTFFCSSRVTYLNWYDDATTVAAAANDRITLHIFTILSSSFFQSLLNIYISIDCWGE